MRGGHTRARRFGETEVRDAAAVLDIQQDVARLQVPGDDLPRSVAKRIWQSLQGNPFRVVAVAVCVLVVVAVAVYALGLPALPLGLLDLLRFRAVSSATRPMSVVKLMKPCSMPPVTPSSWLTF